MAVTDTAQHQLVAVYRWVLQSMVCRHCCPPTTTSLMCCQTVSWTRSQNRSWYGCVGASCQILPYTPTIGALPCSSMPHCAPSPHALPCSLSCPASAFILPCPAVKPALPLTSLCPYQICQICPPQLLDGITVASLKHASHPAPHPAQHIAVSSVILACTLHTLIACSGSSSLTP